MTKPPLTVIITQREQFTLSLPALDSVLDDRSYPYQLIYVDGNSPPEVYRGLQERAERYPFMQLIRRERFLRSNQARRLALQHLSHREGYVVFKDNVVYAQPGWLQAMVECAEQTGAGFVSPIITQGDPASPDPEIHFLNSRLEITPQPDGRINLQQVALEHGTPLSRLAEKPGRQRLTLLEPHCYMIKAGLLDRVRFEPYMDDLCTHVDLALQAGRLKQAMFIEPRAVVNYPDPAVYWTLDAVDLRLYRFAWSEKAIRRGLGRLKKKWNLAEDAHFLTGARRWAIETRQLPVEYATAPGSRLRRLLIATRRPAFPGWLRSRVEALALAAAYPRRAATYSTAVAPARPGLDRLTQTFVTYNHWTTLNELTRFRDHLEKDVAVLNRELAGYRRALEDLQSHKDRADAYNRHLEQDIQQLQRLVREKLNDPGLENGQPAAELWLENARLKADAAARLDYTARLEQQIELKNRHIERLESRLAAGPKAGLARRLINGWRSS